MVARKIASLLVSHHVAACVNIVPQIESQYWWKGAVERARESLLLIKTTASCFQRLQRAILAAHPYDVPEIIALPVRAGYQPYLRWVHTSLS